MNFLNYLLHTIESIPKEQAFNDNCKLGRGEKTPQMIADRKKTMRLKRIKKYTDYFSLHPEGDVVVTIAILVGLHRDSVGNDMRSFELEGLVKRVGIRPARGSGSRPAIIWKWNMEMALIELETIEENKE